MKLTIKFLKPFSDVVGKQELTVEFDGSTLKDLLKVLVEKYPHLKKEFYTETEQLAEYLCIFVNDKPLFALDGIHTGLKNGDELLFFIPVSGG